MKSFKLDNEPKITSGFTMPDDYFDSFTDKVLARIPKEEPKVISFFSRRKTWYYVAAAVIVMLLFVPIYNNFTTQSNEVDAVALEDYVTNQATISDEEIANLLDQEDLEKMKLELNLGEEAMEDILINNNDLEQYIID
ncbi:hypothetical protein IVB69_10995 [Flavobacterium sp. J49]|uniref:hypothetical protein n=1 Tax=Flavobacterium sp. J49 TaxID=2718534 RepID=UPI001593F840|nr:hypothetical protein [Flavobacterium sp. J49]MBF6642008.1 hypothetical protein [Flavobacterium sp. J49]NIC03256.1 hypothetical protein [Flavobacterium sp. J49]